MTCPLEVNRNMVLSVGQEGKLRHLDFFICIDDLF